MSLVRTVLDRIKDEPALVGSLVGGVLITVQEFGLPLTDGQETAIQILTAALVSLFVRSKVVPAHRAG